MEPLFRALALAIVGCIFILLLKPKAAEIGLMLSIGVSVLVFILGIELLRGIFDFINLLQNATNLSPEMIGPVMKVVGIGIVSRISADICKDAGQTAIGNVVELIGTITALFVSLPLMQTVFQMIGRLL